MNCYWLPLHPSDFFPFPPKRSLHSLTLHSLNQSPKNWVPRGVYCYSPCPRNIEQTQIYCHGCKIWMVSSPLRQYWRLPRKGCPSWNCRRGTQHWNREQADIVVRIFEVLTQTVPSAFQRHLFLWLARAYHYWGQYSVYIVSIDFWTITLDKTVVWY